MSIDQPSMQLHCRGAFCDDVVSHASRLECVAFDAAAAAAVINTRLLQLLLPLMLVQTIHTNVSAQSEQHISLGIARSAQSQYTQRSQRHPSAHKSPSHPPNHRFACALSLSFSHCLCICNVLLCVHLSYQRAQNDGELSSSSALQSLRSHSFSHALELWLSLSRIVSDRVTVLNTTYTNKCTASALFRIWVTSARDFAKRRCVVNREIERIRSVGGIGWFDGWC